MDEATLKIKLTNFLGSFVKDVENLEGNFEECVCIPIDRNGLKKNHNNEVNSYCFVNRTKIPLDGWTHYLRLKGSVSFVKKINAQGYKLPYIGNIKQNPNLKYTYGQKKLVKNIEDE